jgi:glycosyltransferase involved in cell wall biosynthesis
MMGDKIKVINIMSHPPAYGIVENEPRPEVNWDAPAGRWLGIWGKDWHDLLGHEILKITDELEYEVWQPDYRADKIYTHRFDYGLVHKLFPARIKKYRDGLRINQAIFSAPILGMLEPLSEDGQPHVLHLDASFSPMSDRIVSRFYQRIPMVHQFYGDFKSYFFRKKQKNILKAFHQSLRERKLSNYFSKFRNVLTCRTEHLDLLRENLKARVHTISWGIDFDYWSRDKSKEEARELLHIPQDKFVILSSSRLYPVKQIDKLIEVLGSLSNRDFRCYITGHGTDAYEGELKELAKRRNVQDHVIFVGFLSTDILKDYYLASDLFTSTSASEMGPHSAELAMAAGVPVMATDTGMVGLILKENNSGVVLPVDDYRRWADELEKAVSGRKIKPVPRDIVRFIFDGARIIREYKDIYQAASAQFKGAKK